jgi:hypothetical protein
LCIGAVELGGVGFTIYDKGSLGDQDERDLARAVMLETNWILLNGDVATRVVCAKVDARDRFKVNLWATQFAAKSSAEAAAAMLEAMVLANQFDIKMYHSGDRVLRADFWDRATSDVLLPAPVAERTSKTRTSTTTTAHPATATSGWQGSQNAASSGAQQTIVGVVAAFISLILILLVFGLWRVRRSAPVVLDMKFARDASQVQAGSPAYPSARTAVHAQLRSSSPQQQPWSQAGLGVMSDSYAQVQATLSKPVGSSQPQYGGTINEAVPRNHVRVATPVPQAWAIGKARAYSSPPPIADAYRDSEMFESIQAMVSKLMSDPDDTSYLDIGMRPDSAAGMNRLDRMPSSLSTHFYPIGHGIVFGHDLQPEAVTQL